MAHDLNLIMKEWLKAAGEWNTSEKSFIFGGRITIWLNGKQLFPSYPYSEDWTLNEIQGNGMIFSLTIKIAKTRFDCSPRSWRSSFLF